MDVTDIEAGVDFVEALQRAVGSCDVLIAVLGREWLTCKDRNGRRRLDDPHDFIRLEIGTALARNVRVIPVLVEGAVMPSASELPPDLEGLTRRQAVELRDSRWNADVESLATVLDRVLDPRRLRDERVSTQSRPRRARFWVAAAAVLVAAVAAAAWLFPPGEWMSFVPAPQVSSDAPASGDHRTTVQPSAQLPTPNAAPPPQPARSTAPPPTTTAPTTSPTTTAPKATPSVTAPAPPTTAPVSPERGARAEIVPPESRPSAATPFLGMHVADAADSSGARNRGAIVNAIAAGGPAATAGLLPGDLVVEYGGTRVGDASTLARLSSASVPGDTVLVRVIRGDAGRTLEVVVGERPGTAAVLIYYRTDADQETAEDLVTELRKSINDPRYSFRTLKTSRSTDGDVLYNPFGHETLAWTVARSAGPWLSGRYRPPGCLHADCRFSRDLDKRHRGHAWHDRFTGNPTC